jgi:ankyrin repeat protein
MDNLKQALKDAISSGNSMDEKEFLQIFNAMDDEEDEREHLDALCDAIRSKNKAIIKLFLKAFRNSETDLHYHSEGCNLTVLGCAVEQGDLEIVKLLVEAGCDPNAGDDYGYETALHDACRCGEFDILDFFLTEAGGNLYLYDGDRETLLSIASYYGNLDMVKYLIEKVGYDPHEGVDYRQLKNPLMSAFESATSEWSSDDFDNSDVIDYLIEKAKIDINEQDASGKTILMDAVQKDNLELVKIILSKNPDINVRDNENETADYYFIGSKNQELLDVLNDLYDGSPEYLKTP